MRPHKSNVFRLQLFSCSINIHVGNLGKWSGNIKQKQRRSYNGFTSDLMHPIFHGSVTHAFVERICGQDQDEVLSPLHTLDQFVLKFTSFQLLHIYEDAVSSDLQVHLQKAWEKGGRKWQKSERNVALAQARMNKANTSAFCPSPVRILTWPAGSRWSVGSWWTHQALEVGRLCGMALVACSYRTVSWPCGLH